MCPLCQQEVPPNRGVWFAHLGVLTHTGCCSKVLTAAHRVYDRSRRGRWRRSKREILRVARAAMAEPVDV
jgi:hypothetical protein